MRYVEGLHGVYVDDFLPFCFHSARRPAMGLSTKTVIGLQEIQTITGLSKLKGETHPIPSHQNEFEHCVRLSDSNIR